ncbi:alpha/beta hydrolase [Flexithrix dorotheae]|uniref:alpha/beta hydrolase n=1 Tax=Flexithrix dorotheae TaxID=70993 RepID=UPI00037DC4B0|nr:alpha/beta hydrolase-fold protein [Flexithrix dorotheae]
MFSINKTFSALTFFILLSPLLVFAQIPKGKVIEKQKHSSSILGYDVNYSVYLPADYDHSERSYPVVYLLHGYTDNETAWVQFGEVDRTADQAIASGEIPPMIIIMPDGGVTFYINDHKGKEKWEDMFVEEFIPSIEKKFRIRSKKEFRGIAGLSMGGYGSAIMAMKHPDMFAAAAPFSAAFFPSEDFAKMPKENYDRTFAKLFGEGLEGEDRINAHFKANSPFEVAKNNTEAIKKVKWYIDCGDDDFLYKGNDQMHSLLRDLEIQHEYRVRDGAHTWSYWRTHIIKGLKFIGESFHR